MRCSQRIHAAVITALLLTLLGLPTGLMAQFNVPQNQAATPEGQEVMKQEQAFRQALKNKDRAAMDGMIGATAIIVNPQGAKTKWQFLEMLQQMNLQTDTVSNVQVRLPGPDTRIVAYQVNQTGTLNGKPLPATSLITSVWYNQNGKWMMVSHQATPIQ